MIISDSSGVSGKAHGESESQRQGCESQCQGTFCLDRNLLWVTPVTHIRDVYKARTEQGTSTWRTWGDN